MNEHTCPVCGYSGEVDFRPRDYQICACCGTEFGYDDRVLTNDQLRAQWLSKGCPWFDLDEPRPVGWNAYDQLLHAGLIPANAEVRATNAETKRPAIHIENPIRVHIGSEPELQLV
jgi:hypothetical protein